MPKSEQHNLNTPKDIHFRLHHKHYNQPPNCYWKYNMRMFHHHLDLEGLLDLGYLYNKLGPM